MLEVTSGNGNVADSPETLEQASNAIHKLVPVKVQIRLSLDKVWIV